MVKKIDLPELKQRISTYMSWREFNFNCHISLKHEFVYLETPKVGCSSIKFAMMHLELEDFALRIEDPHLAFYNMPTVKPYQLDTDLLHEVLFSDRFFRFSFVRNPYTRTLSAYIDKIQRPEKLAGSISRALGVMPGSSIDMSYEEFLSFVLETPALKQDKHWRPQNQMLLHGLLDFHFIGRFETFAADWQQVIERTPPQLGKHSQVFNPHATNADDKLRRYYNGRTTSKLIKAYKDDFDIYGYPPVQT